MKIETPLDCYLRIKRAALVCEFQKKKERAPVIMIRLFEINYSDLIIKIIFK